MRKDSKLFLKKILDYREITGKNSFELNYQYFNEIPNIESAVYDILKDLIDSDCLTSKSQVIDLEGDISINLTLDGITYFDDDMEIALPMVLNVSGGQVNIAKDNANISTVINAGDNEKINKANNVENVIKECSPKDRTGKKVFISYSWTPENNREWVKRLVQRLEQDGVQIVIDYKDLKLGNDKFAFMERIVSDETIDKVLIVCNKSYKEKADSRKGGVGDESAIITSHVYGNIKQEKFIPIVTEYNEDGKPYLPHYLESRMYTDLVDFDKGYKELLANILNKEETVISEAMYMSENTEKNNDDINMFNAPTSFFDYRFRKAFPGIRGKMEFSNPKEGVDRLEILLREPLNNKRQGMTDPIWWFRGGSNLDICKFQRISDTKFLMDSDEIEVKRIIAYETPHYYKKFVYVETSPEQSSGAYGKVNQNYIDEAVKLLGEYHEEYALYQGSIITRAEFDDGAAVIDGKVVDLAGKAELRIRYLTPYNFIICAKWNPINESRYDNRIKKILNGILNGTDTIDTLIDLCESLPRHKNDL